MTSASEIIDKRFRKEPGYQEALTEARAETKALVELEKWNNDGPHDNEVVHSICDNILLEYLDVVAPDVSAKYREVKEKVGFWYA